jgi:hypothetical protein
MLAFASMLIRPAEAAGIPIPPDLDKFNDEDFIRWNIFCHMQLGQSMPSPGIHWENAKVIAAIPEDKLKTITPREILDMGFAVGSSRP